MKSIIKQRDFSVIAFSVLLISAVRFLYSILLTSWSEINSSGDLVAVNNLFVYITLPFQIVIFIIFLFYGWSIRRKFVKKNLDVGDQVINYIVKIFLIIFLPILIFTIIISLIANSVFILVFISSLLNETMQLTFLAVVLGILAYNPIEQIVAPLFKKEVLESKKQLGLSSLDSHVEYIIGKFWSLGLLVILFFIFFSNLLVLLIYPTIPVVPSKYNTLLIAYPNFNFEFNPKTGLHQEFFTYYLIDTQLLLNWKLIQSVLCLTFFAVIAFLYYLPRVKYFEKQNKTEVQEKKDVELEQLSIEDVAASILLPNSNVDLYVPSGQIKTRKRKIESIYKRIVESDLIPVTNLAIFNIALAIVIVFILQLFLPLSTIQDYDLFDLSFIGLTHLYWAGLVEEISFRFLIFGLPLFVLHGIDFLFTKTIRYNLTERGKNEGSSSSIWNKISKREMKNPFIYLTGGWKKLNVLDFVFFITSSFFFGYVHYQFGSWGTWKIFQAGVGGLIFGYAFYKYGLHAAIFLHTVNDVVLGLMTTANIGLIVNGGFTFFFMLIMGLLYILYLSGRSLKIFLNRTVIKSKRTDVKQDHAIQSEEEN
ncbi:MAG: hypothetical protein ACTSQE_03160 [Candidatus Heimdallarchaeaceae archaeon]